MRKFSRSIQSILYVVSLILLLFAFIFNIVFFSNLLDFKSVPIHIFWCTLISGLFIYIISFILKPDFEYHIKKVDDYIIFDFSDDDCRKINKNFIISKRTRKYILLDDGTAKMKIAYNDKVIKFLEEIQKN